VAQDPITGLIHHPYQPPSGFAAPQQPIHKASTVIFPNVAAMRSRDWKSRAGYTYGLHGTPSTFLLEERLCSLEGGLQCVLVPSGLAAIANVALALLDAGDELLIPDNAYGPNKALAQGELARFGITHQFYDAMDPQDLARRISAKTRLVWLEAPGSVSMEFPDLPALVAVCRERKVLTALDNTWGAGLAFAPFDLGIDVSAHALTKYPSGGGDVLMGSVITRDEELHERLLHAHAVLGLGVAANDCELVLRALPTLRVRYEAHDRAARELAAWLATRPEVRRVLHPALPGAPGHEHWRSHCSAAAGLFSVQFDERFGHADIDRFVDALRLFGLGVSWGGPMSLAVPYDLTAMRGAGAALQGPLVRLSIGLEDVTDLRADLQQALEVAFGR